MSTEIRELDSTVVIDGTTYNVNAKKAEIADVANQVTGKLTIKTGTNPDTEEDVTETFDGSGDVYIDISEISGQISEAIHANKADVADSLKVTTDEGPVYAAITISRNDPSNGNRGDIWFKYW